MNYSKLFPLPLGSITAEGFLKEQLTRNKNGMGGHLDEIEPECDLNYTPNTPVEAPLTIAISDSLGFGGHNGCVAFRRYDG